LRRLLRLTSGSWIALPALVMLLGFGVGFALSELAGDDRGGSGGGGAPAAGPGGTAADPATGERSFLARVVPPPAGSLRGGRLPSGIARMVRSMPLEQKVAQLMLVGFDGHDATAPIFRQLPRRTYGGVMLEQRNYTGAEQLLALTTALKDQVARSRRTQPFVGAVQQGGEWNALPALPPDLAPAETASGGQAARLARTTGQTFTRLGLNAIWAPSLEVGSETGGAMGTRAFSDEPAQVAGYGQATVDAYAATRVLAAPGRFPGLGAAAVAPEEGPPSVGLSADELRLRDLVPYRTVIRAGVPAIVVGHGLYATDDFVVPASQSRAIAQNLLRGQLGFRGLAIADDLTQPAITTTMGAPEAAVASLQAGVDMVYVSGPDSVVGETYDALVAAAKSGTLPKARIDEALTRVLVAKSDLGLLRARKVPPQD
jgi:beta-N-acetylhexosaminidase